jgi:hypothetical protein
MTTPERSAQQKSCELNEAATLETARTFAIAALGENG